MTPVGNNVAIMSVAQMFVALKVTDPIKTSLNSDAFCFAFAFVDKLIVYVYLPFLIDWAEALP